MTSRGSQNGPQNASETLVERNGPNKSARAPKMTPNALPKRLLQRILRIFRPPAEFWGIPEGGPAEQGYACGAGFSSHSSKTDGFASAGAHFSESRLADPGDKYK